MFKLLLLFIFLVSFNKIYSQEPVFSWSRSEAKPGPTLDARVVGYTGDGFFVLNKKAPSASEFTPTLYLDYFVGNERQHSTNITPTNEYDFVDVVYVNQSVHLFTSAYDKQSKKNILYATAVNKNGSKEKPVEMASIEAEKLSARGNFKIAVSPDLSKLLVLAEPAGKKDEPESFTLTLFDQAEKKVWETKQTFPYPRNKAIDNTPFVNNHGTVFLLKRLNPKGETGDYSVFSINADAKLKEYKMPLDGNKKAAWLKHQFAPNGDFITGALYTDDGTISARIGIAYFGNLIQRIDHLGSAQIFYTVNAFPEKRKNIVLKNVLASDNYSVLLSEVFYVTDEGVKNAGNSPGSVMNFERNYGYQGNDIYVDGFDARGKSAYTTIVDKEVQSRNDKGGRVSFLSAIVENKLVLLFNDFAYKYDDKKQLAVVAPQTIPILVKLDPLTGKEEVKAGLLNTGSVGGKRGEMDLRPDVFLRIDEKNYVIRAENEGKYKMGVVSF